MHILKLLSVSRSLFLFFNQRLSGIGIALQAIKLGKMVGPFSIMLEQLVFNLAKWRLNSMPQPLERRKSTRIWRSTWINVHRKVKGAPLRSCVLMVKTPFGLHLKVYCNFWSKPCKYLSVSSREFLTQNRVIRLTSLWNWVWVEPPWVVWVLPLPGWEQYISDKVAGCVNPLKFASPEWSLVTEGIRVKLLVKTRAGWEAHSRSKWCELSS